MAQKPFAVLYRWSVEANQIAAFKERWVATTGMLRDEHGGLGSCLSRDEDGNFVAFARWPSEAHRDKAAAARTPPEPLPGVVLLSETKLWVEEDMLTPQSTND